MMNVIKKRTTFGSVDQAGAGLKDRDRTLLGLLKADAGAKYAELGRAVHLSPPAVFERVKKLKRLGIIRRTTVDIDPRALGLQVLAFVELTYTRLTSPEMAAALEDFAEIEECHSIAGAACMLLKVRTPDSAALEAFLNALQKLPHVERTQTTVVLSSYFERGVRVN